MPAGSYLEDNSLCAMLATKRLADIAPDVNFRDLCMPMPNVNKAADSGFETQRRHHQKSKNRLSLAHKKTYVLERFYKQKTFKKKNCSFFDLPVDTAVQEVVVVVALVYWLEGVRARVTPPGVYSAVVARVILWTHFCRHTLRQKEVFSN